MQIVQEFRKKRDSVIEVLSFMNYRLSGFCERSFFSKGKEIEVRLQLTDENVDGIEIESVSIDYFEKHFSIKRF